MDEQSFIDQYPSKYYELYIDVIIKINLLRALSKLDAETCKTLIYFCCDIVDHQSQNYIINSAVLTAIKSNASNDDIIKILSSHPDQSEIIDAIKIASQMDIQVRSLYSTQLTSEFYEMNGEFYTLARIEKNNHDLQIVLSIILHDTLGFKNRLKDLMHNDVEQYNTIYIARILAFKRLVLNVVSSKSPITVGIENRNHSGELFDELQIESNKQEFEITQPLMQSLLKVLGTFIGSDIYSYYAENNEVIINYPYYLELRYDFKTDSFQRGTKPNLIFEQPIQLSTD